MFEISTLDWADDGSTIAVIPDTQNYTGSGGAYYPVLRQTVDWLIKSREALDLEMVLQVGDLSDRNRPEEWNLARKAFAQLDGVLPYALAVGNHDLGDDEIGGSRNTHMNRFFQLEQNPLNVAAQVDSWQTGKLENRAQRITLAGREWLILVLEFGPRAGALEWADGILRENAKTPTILLTHEFIDNLSIWQHGEALRSRPETHNSPARYTLASHAGGAACACHVWDRIVSRHSQIRAVVNGHYRPFARDELSGQIVPVDGLAEAHRRDVRADGSVVDQFLFNAQWEIMGGNGWLLFLRVTADGNVVASKYSPVATGDFALA